MSQSSKKNRKGESTMARFIGLTEEPKKAEPKAEPKEEVVEVIEETEVEEKPKKAKAKK